VPRYYDEEKEQLNDRYKRIEAELNGKSTLKGSFGSYRLKDKWKRNKNTSNFEKKSNVRLAFITLLLFALCYWMLYL
tara:strand:+ start:1467 stop:1697 length:231 start_codon:yes stop_codon:yes gene_type:complete